MDNSAIFTFEIYFSQDYQSEDQLYREGYWYNIPRITNQPGFETPVRAGNEARSLSQTFHQLSGVKLQWRVIREEVIEVGGL